jgi:hypothetical protein
MSIRLRAGFRPVNRMVPLRIPAVPGSTLKYEGAGSSFFDAVCGSFIPVAEQPAKMATMPARAREPIWNVANELRLIRMLIQN